MSIVLFLLVLFILVLVHEWGHYIVAKKTGMRVDEFAIGFPPKLFGIKRGETEFTFNAFPIGGFVRIFGENAESPSEADTKDVGRAFHSRPKWAQILVLIAGITMNILFAWFLFTLTQVIGVPTAVEEANASPEAELFVAGVLPEAPVAKVLPVGSVILSAQSEEAVLTHPTPVSFSEFVNAHAPNDITLTYSYKNDEEKTVTITPVAGMVEGEPDKYIVGTSLSLVETQKKPLHTAIGHGFMMTVHGVVSISVGLYTLTVDAFSGEADFTHIAGPIGIVGMVGDAAAFGMVALLTFTAVISLNLAVINLLPFPALDGGRIVFVIIEMITRRQVPPVWTGWINLLGFILLMVLMAAVTFNDITRLF